MKTERCDFYNVHAPQLNTILCKYIKTNALLLYTDSKLLYQQHRKPTLSSSSSYLHIICLQITEAHQESFYYALNFHLHLFKFKKRNQIKEQGHWEFKNISIYFSDKRSIWQKFPLIRKTPKQFSLRHRFHYQEVIGFP